MCAILPACGAAALGIVYDPRSHTQTFFTGHDDDCTCIALDSTGRFAVSGQVGKKPYMCVWDTTTTEQFAKVMRMHSSIIFDKESLSVCCIFFKLELFYGGGEIVGPPLFALPRLDTRIELCPLLKGEWERLKHLLRFMSGSFAAVASGR